MGSTQTALMVGDEGSEDMRACQGARYNRACPGGFRLCRQYEGLWLCLSKCWRKRDRIVRMARLDSRREVG